MSNASVLLPDPLTPVTTTNCPRGISTVIFLRLCSRAPWMRIESDSATGASEEKFSPFVTGEKVARSRETANATESRDSAPAQSAAARAPEECWYPATASRRFRGRGARHRQSAWALSPRASSSRQASSPPAFQPRLSHQGARSKLPSSFLSCCDIQRSHSPRLSHPKESPVCYPQKFAS